MQKDGALNAALLGERIHEVGEIDGCAGRVERGERFVAGSLVNALCGGAYAVERVANSLDRSRTNAKSLSAIFRTPFSTPRSL